MRPQVVVVSLALLALTVYLFADRPAPLPSESATAHGSGGTQIPIEEVFRLLAAENSAARNLYTAEIVGAGTKQGLAFHEDWRRLDVQAGPLPALFLRATAERLARSELPLGLFLGSDMPIEASNRFTPEQDALFVEVRASREPRFFIDQATGDHVAMFPDIASVAPCVDCHNEHPNSPKRNWALGDVMGAATWSYPRATVDYKEALQMIAALRSALRGAWGEVLGEASGYSEPVEIGDGWPRDGGRRLPSAEVFQAEYSRRSGPKTTESLLQLAEGR